ncbi:hypothetical protein NG827_09480 [Xanthomonas sacchari]|uniref:hypothetical protein n=1 Tax=Xanthomonas sacchari TaxID=56458 RepID=UPI002255F418|nr:hypothetical protein [Xanthomonas sacchari]UYK86604.1 hypothetical protein NG827_09480 [Xanthomonas sacchari]
MPEAVNVAPFYLDWQFWAAFIACLALILSQLPPIKFFLRPRKLVVEVHRKVEVTHKAGNPNIAFFISIQNKSWRDFRVKSMSVGLFRDGRHVGTFEGQSYFENLKDSTQVLLVPFTLAPGEGWAHNTCFWNDLDRADEQHFRKCEAELSNQIRIRFNERPEGDNSLVAADDELVKPFLEMFDRLFIWNPGEYTLKLSVVADPAGASFEGGYSFTMFESDADELRASTENFKYGFGISINKPNSVYLPIRK